ncbi:MAG: 4-(cytidine 5'-diphospho)-2-C-methyl-D-erythritol kinase [Candidatus Peregrinibacteria bacterium]|nr:4-(cytidine 5'-diphospho)-2-C-methyl-D-erythritol kinase [Candidatus Peregrinibacteria bacterium]
MKAPAKINLSLDVLKRTASGYHEIQTVLQEITEIRDELKIISTKDSDSTSTVYAPKFKGSKTPIPENDNLAHKALLLIKQTYKIKKFAHIIITKNIPLSSGLGGASSDAAAVLKGLNKLWNLKISQKKLLTLAAKLGMDVPFFIVGGTALATHFGEKIKALPPIKNIKFKINLASSSSTLKTASAYSSLDLSLCGKNLAKTKSLLKAIKKSDKKSILASLHNDFETLSSQKTNHHLSGSGPSTFTVI